MTTSKKYIRKTEDEYNILQYARECGIWEIVNCESNWLDARRSLKEYRENSPEIPVKCVKTRVKKEKVS